MTVRKDTDDLIAFLNSLLERDRFAVQQLLEHRVECTRALADHPTVQVRDRLKCECGAISCGTRFDVSILGVLNGYCGTIDAGDKKGWGPITVVFDEFGGTILRFERTVSREEPHPNVESIEFEASEVVESTEAEKIAIHKECGPHCCVHGIHGRGDPHHGAPADR